MPNPITCAIDNLLQSLFVAGHIPYQTIEKPQGIDLLSAKFRSHARDENFLDPPSVYELRTDVVKDSLYSFISKTVFDTRPFHPFIAEIAISIPGDLGEDDFAPFVCSLLFTRKDGEKLRLEVRRLGPVKSAMNVFYQRFPDTHIEFVSGHLTILDGTVEDDYWNDWHAMYPEKIHKYATEKDPLILRAFEENVLKKWDKTQVLTVLEVGGYGRLMRKIKELAQRYDVRVFYILVEPNKNQYELAEKTIQKRGLKDVYIFKGSLLALGNANLGTDVAISCGGPLNHQVATYQEARLNLYILRSLLRENGLLIATGLSSMLVTKENFETANYQVIKTAEKVYQVESSFSVFHGFKWLELYEGNLHKEPTCDKLDFSSDGEEEFYFDAEEDARPAPNKHETTMTIHQFYVARKLAPVPSAAPQPGP